MNKDEILVCYGTHYREMTKHLLKEAGLSGMIPSRNTKIGIKPNLVAQISPEDGATTHPEVVGAILEYLQEEGFEDLVVLESSFVGDSTALALKFCGYDRMLDALDVPFWDLQKDRGIARDCGGMEIQVCSRVKEIGFLINVPVLKGHCQTRMTCAIKNMKGLIPAAEKRRFHRMGLHEPIGHLACGIRQDFILVDSICGDLTLEDGGNPVRQDRLIAACDPVLCDAYGCSVMGLPIDDVPYIRYAGELGAGSTDLESAKIRAWRETAGEEEAPGFVPDSELIRRTPAGYEELLHLFEKTQAVETCSACYGYLIPALKMLEEEGLLERLTEKICIGQGYRGKTGKLGLGNCTRCFEHTLAGCPPTETQMADFLRSYILGDVPEKS